MIASRTNVKVGDTVRALPGPLGRRAGRLASVVALEPHRLVVQWETGGVARSYYYCRFEVLQRPNLYEGLRVYNTVVKSYGVITGFSLMGLVQVLYDSGQPGEAHPENLKVVHGRR